jgi:fluoride exporter
MKEILIVGFGGGVGSIARFLSQKGAERLLDSSFPIGTFLVNILGCFIIGVVYSLSERGNFLAPEIRLFLTVGLCGGFTTFSTFSYDNFNMLSERLWQFLLINVGGSIFFGILAVYLGVVAIRLLFS